MNRRDAIAEPFPVWRAIRAKEGHIKFWIFLRLAQRNPIQAKRVRKANLKRKAEKREAQRSLDLIAPVLKHAEVQMPMLTPQLQENMPPYQVQDAKTWHGTLKDLDAKWTQVLKGATTIHDAELDHNSIRGKLAVAKTSLSTFGLSLDLANQTVGAQTQEPDTVEKKKNKKRRKDGKTRGRGGKKAKKKEKKESDPGINRCRPGSTFSRGARCFCTKKSVGSTNGTLVERRQQRQEEEQERKHYAEEKKDHE